jgi:hypothetical protein
MEFIFSFIYLTEAFSKLSTLSVCADVVIVLQYLKYGRKDFFKAVRENSFTQYFVNHCDVLYGYCCYSAGFKDFDGKYAAFSQNLMMSILFVLLLIKRRNTKGQSVNIAVFKMIGTCFGDCLLDYLQIILIAVHRIYFIF